MKWLSLAALSKCFATFFLVTGAACALASEHGGDAAKPAAPEPMQFTVNVNDASEGDRYLQLTMAFEAAAPEINGLIAAVKPKIQHAIILMLCDEKLADLRTAKGKTDLQERIRKAVNELIDETPRKGVRDVFFTDFIIQ